MAIIGCGSGCSGSPLEACANPVRTYEGAVLATYEHNGYHDSYFYAIVWDGVKGEIKHVEYGATAYSAYHCGVAVDATDDVISAARAALTRGLFNIYLADAQKAASVPVKGSRVRSLTSRGKNKGAEGVVFWVGEDSYAPSYGGEKKYRCGFVNESTGEKTYMSTEKVEVINPTPVDESAILRRAEHKAKTSWR